MRFLVRTPNWLGDLVMALPVFTALRAQERDAILVAAAPAAFAPLLSAVGSIDEVVPLDRAVSGGMARLRAEAATLREGRFDRVLLLPNSFGSAWAARQAGIPERWGYTGPARRLMLTRAVPRPPSRPHRHLPADYQTLVEGVGVAPAAPVPRLAPTGGMTRRARTLLQGVGVDLRRPMVGVAPGAAHGHAKRWSPTSYADVVARLVADRHLQVVLVGSGHDRDAGYAIESSLPRDGLVRDGVFNLIGRTDLAELVGVLAGCHAFISSDSGAMHLAAALGVRVTALFGPTDERLTAPVGSHAVLSRSVRCRPCFFRDCPIDHRCMRRITTSQVFEAVSDGLDQQVGGSS